jgi:chromosome segregation ATPase
MLENLGASLLSRQEQDDNSDYCRLTRDISDSGAYITAIEGDIARLKAIEDDIHRKDQENAALGKDLSRLFIRLGEYVLGEYDLKGGDGIEAVKPYQDQAEILYPKIKSLEERLEQAEDRSDGNVFTWIGKSTQAVVLRSFLGKSRNSLQKIFAAAGEKYSQSVSMEIDDGIRPLLGEIDTLKQEAAAIGADLARLKEERRRINDASSPDGGPAKKILALERHIAHSREELRGVCLRYGREIEAADDEEASAETAVPLMDEADTRLLEDIRESRESIRKYDREIEKLKASLAIDEEKAAIARMEKSIKDHEGRIRAGEEAIASLTAQIKEADARIEELTRLL